MCLAGAIVASWSHMATRGGRFKPFYCNDKYFLSLNSLKNSIVSVYNFLLTKWKRDLKNNASFASGGGNLEKVKWTSTCDIHSTGLIEFDWIYKILCVSVSMCPESRPLRYNIGDT